MIDSNAEYKSVHIIEDASNGLVKIDVLARHGQKRKTKLKNNFIGLLETADSKLLLKLSELLNEKLPQPLPNEIVVGMHKSGIIVCGYLAMARGGKFTWSTEDQLGNYENAISFGEKHRPEKYHYFYALKPGDKVILIEDELSSGKGLIGLAKILRDNHIEILAIAALVETINFNGRKAIKEETGLDLVSLIKVELQS